MERKKLHMIMFSGGASSSYVAKWVIDTYGKENCVLFFTDTLWEDEDNYRFMEECAEYLGMEITTVIDGRTPEDVFFQQKFLGNSRHAKCSEELKIRQTVSYIEKLLMKDIEPIVYFGIGPHEKHRAERLAFLYNEMCTEPIQAKFPMIDSCNIETKARYIIENEWGIKLPRMYDLGFHHANCGGKCVRAGLHHLANLYLVWPDRYAEFEEMEQRFRNQFNYDVAMLKDKNSKPYTLKEYREEKLEKMTKEELISYAKEQDTDNVPCFCSFS